ncbi:hypothetical protein BGX28_007000 [Mortierella sp. GBA30]|nr:hypothetical protein BGX28_007000 [Mortierella sp. GBA30]
MSMNKQGFIHIEEDFVKDSSSPKVIQLRNVANPRPVSSQGSGKTLSRAEVLECLIPLSRAPGSSVPTLVEQSPRRQGPSTSDTAKIPSVSSIQLDSHKAMTLSIFEIPHIQDSIVSLLSSNETVLCTRVCRVWYDVFLPYLYRSLDITDQRTFDLFTTQKSLGALVRNQSHVRALETTFLSTLIRLCPGPLSALTLNNLRRLHCSLPKFRRQLHLPERNKTDGDINILHFIKTHLQLESIILELNKLSPMHLDMLIDILEARRHHRLHELRIHCHNITMHLTGDLLFAAVSASCSYPPPAPSISSSSSVSSSSGSSSLRMPLEIFEFRILAPEFEDNSADDASIESRGTWDTFKGYRSLNIDSAPMETDSAIKDLSFFVYDHLMEHFLLIPLLQRSPGLERLCLVNISIDDTWQALGNHLTKDGQNIKYLSLGEGPLATSADEDLAPVFDGCIHGLLSFTALTRLPLARLCVESILWNLGRTVETLDLAKLERWSFHLFLELIHGCPRLRVLRTSIGFGSELDLEVMEDQSLLFRNWPCNETLKILDLSLYRDSDLEIESNYRPGDGSLTDRFIDYMYTQVGALTELEELSVGGWMMLLRIDWGLRKLSGLKSLQRLDLREHTFIKWSRDEVDWICENWTNLGHILGLKSPNAKGVVKMLKDKRLWMEIS